MVWRMVWRWQWLLRAEITTGGRRCMCVHTCVCVCVSAVAHSWECHYLGLKAKWKGTVEEEEAAWRNMVRIVGLALPCFLSEWFPIAVGLERCSRKRGAVGLSTSPGSGLDHVQSVTEGPGKGTLHRCVSEIRVWPRLRTCWRQEGRPAGFAAAADKEERKFSAERRGDSQGAQGLSSEKFQGCVPGSPQSPQENLRTWKLRVRPALSRRLSGDRWVWQMSLHSTHPDSSQPQEMLTWPLSLLVAQGDLCFSGVRLLQLEYSILIVVWFFVCLFFYTVSHKAINTVPQDKKKVPIPNFCSAKGSSESLLRIGSFNLQNNPAR